MAAERVSADSVPVVRCPSRPIGVYANTDILISELFQIAKCELQIANIKLGPSQLQSASFQFAFCNAPGLDHTLALSASALALMVSSLVMRSTSSTVVRPSRMRRQPSPRRL